MRHATRVLAKLALLGLAVVGLVTVSDYMFDSAGTTRSGVVEPMVQVQPTAMWAEAPDAMRPWLREGIVQPQFEVVQGPPVLGEPYVVRVDESARRTHVRVVETVETLTLLACAALGLGLVAWLVTRSRRRRLKDARITEVDELAMLQEIHGSLSRMEHRIEALETILLDRPAGVGSQR